MPSSQPSAILEANARLSPPPQHGLQLKTKEQWREAFNLPGLSGNLKDSSQYQLRRFVRLPDPYKNECRTAKLPGCSYLFMTNGERVKWWFPALCAIPWLVVVGPYI